MSDCDPTDYHDYVIREGRFIGRFDEMYRACANPWPESDLDLDANPVSCYAATLLARRNLKRVFSFGMGKGAHLRWLGARVPGLAHSGCDISPTAIEEARARHPEIESSVAGIDQFLDRNIDFDVLLLREVIWYILDDWRRFCEGLKRKYAGRYVLAELTFYDEQGYGEEHFDGPDEFITRFPFAIEEVLRHHATPRHASAKEWCWFWQGSSAHKNHQFDLRG